MVNETSSNNVLPPSTSSKLLNESILNFKKTLVYQKIRTI
jgi:hypothetical protein